MSQSIFSGNPNKPQIALTFDDGPHPEYTAKLLDILSKYGIQVTFFCIGQHVNDLADLVKREADEGHLVANHTFTHPHLPQLDDAAVSKELGDTNAAIQTAIGDAPAYFRPPYGETDDRVNALAEALGLTPIIWSVDSNDWQGPGADAIYNTLMTAQNGSIILCHDAVATSDQTLAAVDRAIPDLLAKGFSFVTIADMLTDDVQPEQLMANNFAITIPHPYTPAIAQRITV